MPTNKGTLSMCLPTNLPALVSVLAEREAKRHLKSWTDTHRYYPPSQLSKAYEAFRQFFARAPGTIDERLSHADVMVQVEEVAQLSEGHATEDVERLESKLPEFAAHLAAVGCCHCEQISDYLVAGDQLLHALYQELQSTVPSPTRVKRLALQFSLDPRHEIALHSVPDYEVRRHRLGMGYEVVKNPPFSTPSPSRVVPRPGRVIVRAKSNRLLEFAFAPSLDVLGLVGYLEVLIPNVLRSAVAPVAQSMPYCVDVPTSTITTNNTVYDVPFELAMIADFLLKAKGAWRTRAEWEKELHLDSTRLDRLLASAPSPIKGLFKSCRGKGSRCLGFDAPQAS